MADQKTEPVVLDVREMLRNKQEPLHLIKDTVQALKPDESLIIHATFKPLPLLTYMKRKGYQNEVEHVAKGHWAVTFYPEKGAQP
ncbi:DUF2249 domain-containing protein [Bacillus piscicola]|uniref:DUF2249 domain-containing protein n=1 Tax=Bacillus piscicola TaxID=1632684 RepID=UPI001F09A99D|nr:DUF2249 domain-containing protein [Bacillus piscicola]